MFGFEFNFFILLTGFVIFLARIVDVSIGTLRTIITIQGRKWLAFWLGFFEISIWLTIISTVIHKITDAPILGLFYALGYASGNLAGIMVENWLALGNINLKVISRNDYQQTAKAIREAGYGVTIFHGEGRDGPVAELYIVCSRKDLKFLLKLIHDIEPKAFYVTELTGSVSKIYRPIFQPVTGWRAILKKK